MTLFARKNYDYKGNIFFIRLQMMIVTVKVIALRQYNALITNLMNS